VVLAKTDFEALDLEILLNGAELTSYGLSQKFWSAAGQAEADGDQGRRLWLLLLADVSSYALGPDNQKEPFAPFATWQGKRSASIEDLDQEHLNSLEEVWESVRIPELRARIADVLFVRRKHHRFGKVAIDAYLASAALLGTDGHETFVRLQRAHAIAILIRSERDRIVEFLVRQLEAHKGDATFFSARLMRSLADYRSGDPKSLAALAEAAVTRAKVDGDWHRAREYLLLSALWHKRLADSDAEILAIRDAAECLRPARRPNDFCVGSSFTSGACRAVSSVDSWHPGQDRGTARAYRHRGKSSGRGVQGIRTLDRCFSGRSGGPCCRTRKLCGRSCDQDGHALAA